MEAYREKTSTSSPVEDLELSIARFDKYHLFFHRDYSAFYENYLHNIKNYSTMDYTAIFGFEGVPPFGCGEYIRINNPVDNLREFLVVERNITMDQNIGCNFVVVRP